MTLYSTTLHYTNYSYSYNYSHHYNYNYHNYKYNILQLQLPYITLHYASYITLHHIPLQYTLLRYTTLHPYSQLHHIALH